MFNKIKGTRDFSPLENNVIELIRSAFVNYARNYNFHLIETPIIESATLYKRSVASSDIVKKEMYEFKDKGGRDIALRPEGTAGFVRALVENKWYATLKTTKFAYYGPMFRYEQPQKGRYRQFNQAGFEIVDTIINPYNDAELIIAAASLLQCLDVKYVLKINSIGDEETRIRYQSELKKYFEKYKDQLNPISLERLENNVLRILDDKEESKKDFVKKAPKINKYLSENSTKFFKKLTSILDFNNIKYQVDYSLVRGLDYYDEVVFEFVSTSSQSGSQNTVIGGGRYSTLIKELGGPQLYSCGWGLGVDRIGDIISEENSENNEAEKINILVSSTSEKNLDILFSLTNELRNYGSKIEFIKEVSKSKKIFDKAQKLQADVVIFDDVINGQEVFVAKSLSDNDRIIFQYNEDGYADLLDFLAEHNLLSDLVAQDEDEE
ncbi:histidine--tRNA ligase [Mycoplasmopsis caviae]|uniref:Histidine--tRNA ligase n=1 Tax=Mycoplasmopsis caviae TaxID=55603 RepID=A0A3P8KLI5_9BACT|nr:histidine--tRNA ligase [Mycoplasmopsis caviae]UUD35666.1 histidine--tRNA ligase [Mycoplasmopsis caviae]VDR41588.1 Histidyl-tRNA synthetase [Mycoplasmopsis caviae]